MSMTSHRHVAGFCARGTAPGPPDPPQRDMPARHDHRPDPDDTADFELPDQQALIDALTAGLCPVKAKNETVQRRCRVHQAGLRRFGRSVRGAAARPGGCPASGRRVAAWHP